MIHRDLKHDNVLIGASDIVKLCDFGISRTVDHATGMHGGGGAHVLQSTAMVATPAFMAPEMIESAGGSISTKVDVYSYGVLVWCLVCWSEPYSDLQNSDGKSRAPPHPSVRAEADTYDLHAPVRIRVTNSNSNTNSNTYDSHAPNPGWTLFTLLRAVADGLRPRLPPGCPPEVVELFNACVAPDAASRPTFPEVIAALERDEDAFLRAFAAPPDVPPPTDFFQDTSGHQTYP